MNIGYNKNGPPENRQALIISLRDLHLNYSNQDSGPTMKIEWEKNKPVKPPEPGELCLCSLKKESQMKKR